MHTPASADFCERNQTPKEFVAAAVTAGVDAIAITDHNTGAWIDYVKEAAKGKLTIFPGVEISASGGKSGSIHVLAIFDPSAGTKTIENLLGALSIKDTEYGATTAITTKSPYDVVDVIADHGGLAVLAHADSSNGVLQDMKGEVRAKIMNHPRLAAVEVHDFPKYFKMLDGTDQAYHRELAVFRASDNRSPVRADCHSADGIASRYTYFKMDGITLESLRQCFCDREVRICPDVEAESESEAHYPRILRAKVTDGFLKGQDASFHEGLNCIIGGKGVGKSLLIECIRFALCQQSPIKAIQNDAAGKLAERLGIGGCVRLTVSLATGQTLVIEREFDGDENPIRIRDEETGEDIAADVREIFPILAYSQMEAIEITRDGAAQLALIDTFLEAGDVERHRSMLLMKLGESDKQLAHAYRAASGVVQYREKLATVEAQIKHVTQALKSPRFGELQQLAPKSECISELTEFADALAAACEALTEAVEECGVPQLPAAYQKDMELNEAVAGAKKLANELLASAKQLGVKVATAAASYARLDATWARRVKEQTEAFRRWTQESARCAPALLR